MKESTLPGRDNPTSLSSMRLVYLLILIWSLAYGVLFVYIEQLESHKGSFWSGIEGVEWAGVAVAFLAYTAVVAALGILTGFVLSRVLKSPRVRVFAAPLASGFGVVSTWVIFCLLMEGQKPVLTFLVPLAVAVSVLASLTLAKLGRTNTGALGIVSLLALLSGISVLHLLHGVLLPFEQSVLIACRVSGIAVLGVFIVGWVSLAGLFRRCTGLLLCSALALLFPASVFTTPWFFAAHGKPSGPNLVFITCDALRADYCSSYGGQAPTANMDRLCEQGVRFGNAYALAPWTTPSVNALFASSYAPLWVGDESVVDWTLRVKTSFFNEGEQTFPEMVKERGYAVAALLGNALLDMPSRLLRGYDTIRVAPHDQGEYRGCFARTPFLRGALAHVFPEVNRRWPFDSSRYLTRYAEMYVTWNRNRAFFLWVHFMDPHAPYAPPASLRPPDLPWAFWPLDAPPEVEYDPPWVLPTGAESAQDLALRYVAASRDCYFAEIQYVDECYGSILNVLGRSGLRDNTYIVLSADHGEEFLDHGNCSHGQSFYGELMHVPLVVAGPGIRQALISEPVSCVDLVPTFADFLGLAPSPLWRGKSLLPQLTSAGSIRADRPCLAGSNDKTRRPAATMIVKDQYKMIREVESGNVELFDLVKDPAEKRNIAAAFPEIVTELTPILDVWEGSLPQQSQSEASDGTDSSLRQETEAQLEALGYIR